MQFQNLFKWHKVLCMINIYLKNEISFIIIEICAAIFSQYIVYKEHYLSLSILALTYRKQQ